MALRAEGVGGLQFVKNVYHAVTSPPAAEPLFELSINYERHKKLK